MIFKIVWVLWFVSEVFLNMFHRSGRDDRQNQDKGSFRIIWITIGIANTAGIIVAVYVRTPISDSMIPAYSGLILILLGMIIRFISIRTLGRFFTVNLTVRDQHK